MKCPIESADPDALADPTVFRDAIMAPCRPVLLPGVARHWPLVAEGAAGAPQRLLRFDAGREAELFVGPPAIGGRYHYADPGLRRFNYARETMPFGAALRRIVATADRSGEPSLYMGSLTAQTYLPGIQAETGLAFLPPGVAPRFWIGHASSVACHYDTMDNIACVVAGRRRFTLYPPEAIASLYVGPIDRTMAGQPVSLAMGSEPGDPRYPRFDAIRDAAIVVELAPGDGLYLPKLWWHAVEATDPFNILVNFWWDGFAAGPDQPYAAMLLAMIALSERPPAERAAWRAWFDHYVFRSDGHPLAFLDPADRGVLGPLEEGNYGRIRAIVMRMLRGA